QKRVDVYIYLLHLVRWCAIIGINYKLVTAHYKPPYPMAQTGKKTIEELLKDQQIKKLDKDAMDQVTGGKRRGTYSRRVCGGIMPQ
ncbi:MAG: hypothetical protein WA952_10095, partial [Lewinella sp.]